jgi:hypothetical protein
MKGPTEFQYFKAHDRAGWPSRALCHLVHRGTASQTQSATQLTTAKFYSRLHHAVIRVYDAAGNVIEANEHAGEFKEP